MLKCGINFVARSKYVKEILFKRVSVKTETKSFNEYSAQLKVCRGFGRSYNRPPFQNVYFSYKKPAILLSGILSFLDFREKKPEEPELIMKMKKGILYMQTGQFDKAETELHVALKLAQDEKDEEGITYIYDILANLAFDTGNFLKAKPLFVEVLKRLLGKGEEQESNKVVHISLKLAKIFQETEDYKSAAKGFDFCIQALEKKVKDEETDTDTLALWGLTMDWYGRFLLSAGKTDEALDCIKKAYDTCVKVNGMEHEQTAVLLNDLGTLTSLLGDVETAMSYFEQARDIGNKLTEMEDLAAIYINLGQLYMMREMYNESRNACEEGLKKARSLKDEVSLMKAEECLENIEKVFKKSKAVAV